MDSPDIQAKYQKLATEYTKLRAQNQVLKKHIIEEQGKTTELTDSLKNRDQLLRKAQGENESLIFRNQQLTKRLTLLQEDLDELQSKKKGRGRSGSDNVVDGPSVDNNIFSEELQLKIKENARLQSELADVETNYRRRISELEAALEKSQQESQKNRELLQIREKSANEMVDQLENERVRQVVVAQQKEAEIQSLKEQLKALQERIGSPKISEASKSHQESTTQDKILSEQSAKRKQLLSYALDIPVQNGREKVPSTSAKSLVESFDGLIQELCDLCAEFLHCYSRRIKLCEQSSEVKVKLIENLKSAATPWHSLSSSYHQLVKSVSGEGFIALETLSGLSNVSQCVVSCGASLRKVLPLVVHWISEGCSLTVDGDRIDAAWSSSFSRLVSSWGSLAPYVAALASQSSPNSNLPPSAQGRVITMLSDRLVNLHAAFSEAANIYQRKANAEKDQQSTSREANAVNEELINALNSLSSTTNRMSTTFREQVVPSWNRGGSTPSTPSSPYPSMPYGLSKSPSNSNSVTQDESHQVLYDGTLSSPINDSNFGDTETSLKKQLAVTSSKLSQLEAEREHWRLEHQLLQCKLQKVTKRVRQLEQQLKGEATASDGDADTVHTRDHSVSVISNTSFVGEVQSSEGVPDEREKDIRNHFTSRCSHLYMQLTSALSQASLYQNECESLMKRLVVSEENQTSTEVEVDKQRENVSYLKETLQTTSRNYEEQISTMSEHLADLNERIASQTEYIEQLKYEIKAKKGKK
ncbi:protein phosphatase 1 regulatory subunit 21-like [Macrobrachium rosenbergii]|uniref:protein phosphatase 1 regulatory subunit 21-like n=1 Tax=Macrobrachium rosenbergii TaxID=79674 RepID=UPI0034D57876